MNIVRRVSWAMMLLVCLACGCGATPQASSAGQAPGTAPRAAAPAPSANGKEPPDLQGITAAHNRVRARVGVPPLTWNPRLADVARRWANACVDVAPPRGMIDHSAGRSELFQGPLGENLHATTAPVVDPIEALQGWAAEAKDYDRERNACTGGMCGHYTQVVWRTTREVGCGVGACPRLRFRTTLVCNYWPAGNWEGERPY